MVARRLNDLIIRRAAATALGLIAATLAACSVGNADTGAAPAPPQIPVATPVVQAVTPTYQYPGRAEAIDRVELRPRVSGQIEAVLFEEGAFVKKGQPLFRLDARPYRARAAEAEATLALAQAEFKLAREEHARAERLAERDAIARQEVDRRAAAVAAAQARVDAARASRDAAALELSFTHVVAPISGRIGRAHATVGNQVSAVAGGGTLLAILVTTDPIYVVFDVEDGIGAQMGSAAEVRFTANGIDAPGRLAFVENELGQGTGTLRARAVIANGDGLLVPGVIGNVTLSLAQRTDAVLVDEKAIGTDQGQRFVLAVGKDNALEYRPVVLGARIGALRVVEQGLAAADAVVVNGLMRVRPGAHIQPVIVSMERAAAGNYSPIDTTVVAGKGE